MRVHCFKLIAYSRQSVHAKVWRSLIFFLYVNVARFASACRTSITTTKPNLTLPVYISQILARHASIQHGSSSGQLVQSLSPFSHCHGTTYILPEQHAHHKQAHSSLQVARKKKKRPFLSHAKPPLLLFFSLSFVQGDGQRQTHWLWGLLTCSFCKYPFNY